MKISLLLLILCAAIIGTLSMLGLLQLSPLLIFIFGFAIAMIVIFAGGIMLAKKRNGNTHE